MARGRVCDGIRHARSAGAGGGVRRRRRQQPDGGAVCKPPYGNWHRLLAALFSDDIRKVGHDVKDMMRALLERELPADGFVFDTALAAYLVDATAGKYDLPRLFVSYYNEELPKPAHLQPDAFSPLAGDVVPAQTALLSYTSAVSALYETLPPKLRDMQLEELYYQVELPLCRVLADMEIVSFPVDRKELAAFGAVLQGGHRPDGAGHLSGGRGEVQHQFAPAAGAGAL